MAHYTSDCDGCGTVSSEHHPECLFGSRHKMTPEDIRVLWAGSPSERLLKARFMRRLRSCLLPNEWVRSKAERFCGW